MFNVNEFKSRMNRHGGPSLNSLFVVEIAAAGLNARTGSNIETISTDDLRFFCRSVSVPGINLELMQYKPVGTGFPEFLPMAATPGTLNCVFMLDTNHNVIAFFHRWINSIMNVGGNTGTTSAFNGQMRELNYKNEYSASLVVKHYSTYFEDSDGTPGFYEYKFEGVYPSEVGGSQFSWDDSSISTTAVNFSYTRILHSGFQRASAENSRFITGSQNSIVRGSRIPQIINDRVLPVNPVTIG
jgi:hypothetical protein